MNNTGTIRLGVMTSGGDAQGMNAALRSVVRTGLTRGIEMFAIQEGFQGMIEGGHKIHPLNWDSVGGIIYQGGTILGTARSAAFRTREGRLQAVANLLAYGIDSLVVIGGDGSLTGAHVLFQEWHDLVQELLLNNIISKEVAAKHSALIITGIVGSIDNDMQGTDMTIGADSALQRITNAVDAISSTAASHQRTFVVEVMGRNCGYLALMSALASGADWVFIPENPPDGDTWQDEMCEYIKAGRHAGRRDSIVIIAEGARERNGSPITSDYVTQTLQSRLGEETRLTILGHVQRGGAPSAFDRNLGTLLGYHAIQEIITCKQDPSREPQIICLRGNRITTAPMVDCIRNSNSVTTAIQEGDYEKAMLSRGGSFKEAFDTFHTTIRALPHPTEPSQKQFRLAILHADAPAPGMNTAVRAAVRIGLDYGHTILGVYNSFQGLATGQIREMNWMSVNGWAPRGGAELGTNRRIISGSDYYSIARSIEENNIQGLLIIGGWSGYESAFRMYNERKNFPAFNIPIVCLPASINNDLPGSDLCIGADTALNSIVEAVDKIKQSAVAQRRCFIVEVMGHYCGYLALMSGLATGAERVYLHEEGVTLKDLQADLELLSDGFKHGKRLGVLIRNEYVNPLYTTEFMRALFEEEGRELFDVRQSILGHLQQGGNPSPFDRIQATRLATKCIQYLIEQVSEDAQNSAFIGLVGLKIVFHPLEDFPRLVDQEFQRPKNQWWMNLRPIAKLMAQAYPH